MRAGATYPPEAIAQQHFLRPEGDPAGAKAAAKGDSENTNGRSLMTADEADAGSELTAGVFK